MSEPTSGSLDRLVAELQDEVMAEIRAQFSPVVIDHWQHPRNHGAMARPDGRGRITGSCGDSMEIFLRVVDGRIAEASFVTDGCGSSVAAASMAVELATGRALVEASRLSAGDILAALDGLPDDHRHCALLAARTLHAAVASYRSPSG